MSIWNAIFFPNGECKPLKQPRLYFLNTLVMLASMVTGACTQGVMEYLTPYRIDIRQGNLVTQKAATQIKPGMTSDQVKFILGTPLLRDVFHANRWDYVYYFNPEEGNTEQRQLSVYFQDGLVTKVVNNFVGKVKDKETPDTRVIEINAPKDN